VTLPIVGSRVVLRDWREADLPALREWLRPHHEWHRWDGPYFGAPTDAEADAWCASLATSIAAGDWPTPRSRLVIADPADDRLIGSVSWHYESRETDWRRIGVVLYDPAAWSGGRGTEAVALWTSYLFATTDIVRLDYATWSGNTRMCRLGRRLGWTEEGRFRMARVVDGEHDSVVYGVLRSEWEPRSTG
jgi:RimJ/RimL family protein N-acetyltransferase